jgi:hypothetical protein
MWEKSGDILVSENTYKKISVNESFFQMLITFLFLRGTVSVLSIPSVC